mmetsp:Transcript_40739/g.93722  ORF Transcript_40739/g.93722 Transcript_40739/m.93722 type:complete len:96 (+) Transcript_40739:128-415(+)
MAEGTLSIEALIHMYTGAVEHGAAGTIGSNKGHNEAVDATSCAEVVDRVLAYAAEQHMSHEETVRWLRKCRGRSLDTFFRQVDSHRQMREAELAR